MLCLRLRNKNGTESIETLLVTGLVTNQTIRTAEMLDIKTILFINGKTPSKAVLELADELDMILLTTNNTLFSASGKLYENKLKSI